MTTYPKCLAAVALTAICLPCLNSCGLPAATGRSLNKAFGASLGDDSAARAAMIESLREIQGGWENRGINPLAADSTR